MRPLPRRLLAITTGALAAICAAPATVPAAEMEVAMQDDLTLIDGYADRDLALDQFVAMGGTHVRMTIDHRRERRYRRDTSFGARRSTEAYDQAIDAVLDRGLEVQLTLFWREQTDPKLIARWMGTVVRHFGDKVGRYSVGNEPDLYMREASRCNAATKRKMRKQFPDDIRRNRADVLTEGRTIGLQQACLRYQRGLNYKEIFPPAARAIRRANPDAEVLAGETSALRGLEWFFAGSEIRSLDADGYAHHPFQYRDLTPNKKANGWGIGNYNMLRRQVRMPIYLTEFGYPHPNSTMDRRVFGRRLTYKEIAKALPLAWKVARNKGARQMLQYQWFQKPDFRTEYWDTALIKDDDGTTSPAYDALKKYIASW